jgi:hypothetical protein
MAADAAVSQTITTDMAIRHIVRDHNGQALSYVLL